MRKVVASVVIAVVAAGACLGGVAGAHDYSGTTASTIGYDQDAGQFTGRVGSTHAECFAGRRVRLEKHTAAGLKVVGRTRTGPEGHWAIPKPKAEGSYWVVVRRRIETTNEHRHVCRRGGSATITVDPK